jgi:pimeloyl-ACP methyl ester carboxylesterase
MIAEFTQVCAYDRAGLAWSDAAPHPRTFERILDDVDRVLTHIGTGRRSILVGHSFGSLVVRGYAAREPTRVAGLVLVDPPMEWMHLVPERVRTLRGAAALAHLGAFLARIGVVRLSLALLTGGHPGVPRRFVRVFGARAARTLERLVGEVRKLPPDVHPVLQSHWSQPKGFYAMADHLRVLQREGAAIARITPPPHIPVVVISGGHQTPEDIVAHRQLAAASPHGRHVIATNSGHWIPFDEPEVIVAAVRDLAASVNQLGEPGSF